MRGLDTVLLDAMGLERRGRLRELTPYEWQYGTDGKTWTNMPVTLPAKTTIENLTPGTQYSFRYRAVTKAGEGDWSMSATLVMT